ncbi:MAG: glycosyltransferase family 4 protein [Phycisphaeraceae bacterium]
MSHADSAKACPGQPPCSTADVLLVSRSPLWPADKGFRVHGSQMALALQRLGYRVAIACIQRDEPGQPASAPPPTLRHLVQPWPEATSQHREEMARAWAGPAAPLRRKLMHYRGVDPSESAGVLALVDRLKPRVVIALDRLGPAVLRTLRLRPNLARLWYAADEGAYFHLSCMTREPWRNWPGCTRDAAVLAMQERAFGAVGDAGFGVIGVHPRDTRLLGLATGTPHERTATIRNGVDLDAFRPRCVKSTDPPRHPDPAPDPQTLVFWGRLDFPPNVDAAVWLARRLMPALLDRYPDARCRLVGRAAGPVVQALAELPGIELVGPVDDLRGEALRSATVVMPMRCGGGIKNKLLEAAAMGLPIVASRKAVDGLVWDASNPPFATADGIGETSLAIQSLWQDARRSRTLGANARRWVETHHTWDHAAEQLVDLAEQCLGEAWPAEVAHADAVRAAA